MPIEEKVSYIIVYKELYTKEMTFDMRYYMLEWAIKTQTTNEIGCENVMYEYAGSTYLFATN